MKHFSREQLESGLAEIRQSPKDKGVLNLIVRRPDVDQREVLQEGMLDVAHGLVGDNWLAKGNRKTTDGKADLDMQLNIMNTRAISLVAQQEDRWSLAGDQLFIDMDLSKENLPAGTKLSIGTAIVEVTSPPHSGCKKFAARFGLEAMMFVNSGIGKKLCLRGICARVVQGGIISVQDVAEKL